MLAARPASVCLAAGLILWLTTSCNLFLFVPTITPIPTSTPVGTQIEPLITAQPALTSEIPDKTLVVGEVLSSSTPTLLKEFSYPTSTATSQPASGLNPENRLPTLDSGDPVTITYIRMVTNESGWGIGNTAGDEDHVLRTDDGGDTWIDVSPPVVIPETGELIHTVVFFLDRDHAWVAYQPYDVVWFTADGGGTWGRSATGYTGYLGAMFWFTDQEHGWLMIFIDAGMSHVFSTLLKTATGGKNWVPILDPSDDNQLQAFSKTGMVFVDENTGWVTRDSGGVQPGAFVESTRDGGISWQTIYLPSPEQDPEKFNREYCWTHSPTLFSAADGALVVECKNYQGDQMTGTAYLFSTEDGGNNWKRFDFPGGQLNFIDRQTAFALSREIYKTVDRGLSWEQVKRVEWEGQFSFVDEDRAWAVAQSGEAIALVKTLNGCLTWALLEPEIRANLE